MSTGVPLPRAWRRAGRGALAATLPVALLLTLGGVTVVHPPLAAPPPDAVTYPAALAPRIAVTTSATFDGAGRPTDSRLHDFAYRPGVEAIGSRSMLPAGDDSSADDPATADLSYSPDGSEVVYSEQTDPDDNPDTPDVWRLMTAGVLGAQEDQAAGPLDAPTPLDASPRETDSDFGAQWSPDGRHIAFVRNRPVDAAGQPATDGPRIWIYDLDQPADDPAPNPAPIELPDPAGDDMLIQWSIDPSWSPDGGSLVFRGRIGEFMGMFAPPQPGYRDGPSALWHYDLSSGTASEIVLGPGVCFTMADEDDYCPDDFSGIDELAWSPTDPQVLAIVEDGFTVYRLTLPADLTPVAGTITVTENAVGWTDADAVDPEYEGPTINDIAWLPTGSLLLDVDTWTGEGDQYSIFELPPPTDDEPMPAATLLTDQFAYATSMSVQPWSDLGLEAELSPATVVGTPVTVTVTVTNHGPSPSRPGWLLLGIPRGSTAVQPPPGCVIASSSAVRCEVARLEPLTETPDASAQLSVEYSFTPQVPGGTYWDASVSSPSPDPTVSRFAGGSNYESDYLTLADEPSLPTNARQERLSFTMDRVGEIDGENSWSLDLVQSLADPASTSENYRVLASGTVDGPEGPQLRNEDGLDYSPDGSRVAYSREILPTEEASYDTENHRIVVADVSGSRQADPGTFGGATEIVAPEPPPNPVPDDLFTDVDPAWSPDGSSLAVVRRYFDPNASWTTIGSSRLLLLDPAGTDAATDLLDPTWLADTGGLEISSPTWSPDGGGIVFAVEDGSVAGSDQPRGLWYVPVTGTTETPVPLDFAPGVTDCAGLSEPCMGIVPARAPAFSPPGGSGPARLAVTAGAPEFEGGRAGDAVFVLDLLTGPGAPPTASAVTRLSAEQDPDLDEWVGFYEPAWSPDGGLLTTAARTEAFEGTGEEPSSLVTFHLDYGVSTVDFRPLTPEYSLSNPAYEPVADLAIGLEADAEVTAGRPATVEWTLTNTGPSPARDGEVTIEIPAGAELDYVPYRCTLASTTLTCSVDGPIAVGDSVSGQIDVYLSTAGANDVTAAIRTNSIDPVADNDEVAITIDAAAPTYPETERIAFSLRGEQPSEYYSGPPSHDLVQSVPEPAGAAGPDSYLVLADSVFPELTFPGGAGTGTPYPTDEDNIDYSPDGGRVVYDRISEHQLDIGSGYATSARQLVVADVYGRQQGDLGEPGTLDLANITALTDPVVDVGDDRDALYTDSEPVWSPDATRVAFVRAPYDRGFDGELSVIDVATGDLTFPLAGFDDVHRVSSPTWSPDGTGLIFSAVIGDTYRMELFYVSLADPTLRPIVLGPDDCAVGSEPCGVDGAEPSWSPGGDRVAFTDLISDFDGLFVLDLPQIDPAAAGDIVVTTPVAIDLADSGADPGADPDAYSELDVSAPTWSPDGERIALARSLGRDRPDQIVEIDPAVEDAVPTSMYTAEYTRYAYQSAVDHPDYVPLSDLGLTLDHPGPIPAGGSTAVTVTVTNTGPSPARDAHVRIPVPDGVVPGPLPAGCALTAATITCIHDDTIPVGDHVTFTIPVGLPGDAGDHELGVTVTTNSIDPNGGNDTAAIVLTTTSVPSPTPTPSPSDPSHPADTDADLRVRLTLAEDRAWLGGDGLEASIVVHNGGPVTAVGTQLTLSIPESVELTDPGPCPRRGVCLLGDLGPDEQTTLRLTLLPTEVGDLEIEAVVAATTPDPAPANNTATAAFEAVQATLRLLPAVARPGDVTLLYGVDLPPDAVISTRWSEGVTASAGPIEARDDGTLRFSMLIIEGDELGEREVEVTHVSGTSFGLETPPTLLVVPRGLEPPEFVTRG
ncbi:DUF11 domain-containing protein [Pseudactinotalea sp. HY160]|uniref:DUF11 domain-containing protein n=1 Tax=Pseudactinotalea sp. HY160 TaxID=2654490 RepID=UPI0018842837|nr:DUF11 domain-containing protein [Pseudactinotalea sp. HY160]